MIFTVFKAKLTKIFNQGIVMKRVILHSLLFLLPFLTMAQSEVVKLTAEDDKFFEAQLPYLQKWMDEHEIGAVLKAEKLVTFLDKNTVTVYLRLNYQNSDSAAIAYDNLKANFAKMNTLSLETSIFNKTAQLLEIPANQLMVNILSKDEESKDVRISLVGDKIEAKNVGTRAVTSKIDVKVPLRKPIIPASNQKKFKKPTPPTAADLQKAKELEEAYMQTVLKKIRQESEKYFTAPNKGGKFTYLGIRDGALRFEVSDIQREIYRDKGSWAPYEMITFTVACVKDKEDIKVEFTIDAKKGASFPWKPRVSAFIPIDDDKEGKYKMEMYAYIYGAMIERWLENLN